MDSVQVGGKSPRSSNPGDYGFVYSAERPKPPPEAGWRDKQGDDQKISLYSENVIKEGDTTDSVDRESIANLNTTKQQWEVLFTSQNSSHEESSAKKKVAPKWEVKIPYTEKQAGISTDYNSGETSHGDTEDPEMFKKHVDTESAIEREIRLAHEREDILIKEKEDRKKQTDKQKGQGQAIIASYEAESESFHQVYNELAEADRGSDLWSGEHGRRHAEGDNDSDENNEKAYPNESIIEKEIRLQRERESEISRMRKQALPAPHQHIQQQQQQQPQEKHPPTPTAHNTKHEDKDVNHNKPKLVSYEDAIAKNAHEGESMIARELRELKEREEELKTLHSSLFGNSNHDSVDGSAPTSLPSQKANATPESSKKSSQVEAPSSHGIWNRDSFSLAAHPRRESLDSTSSHGSGRTPSDSTPSRRDVKVRPISDDRSDDEDKKLNYFEKQETPIEREMRLTRERENELRRQKGLPEIDQKDENPYGSYGASHVSNNSTAVSRPRSVGQPSESMKKFANSRLQQEMLQQKEREHELRSQGKVISSSEDRIELKKYLEIAGVDRVDGTEKRNFVTKKSSASNNESDASSLGQQEGVSSGGVNTRKISAIASGGNMFSYKEFKQTAESKIEKELRELREREEELRQQRTNYHPEPH